MHRCPTMGLSQLKLQHSKGHLPHCTRMPRHASSSQHPSTRMASFSSGLTVGPRRFRTHQPARPHFSTLACFLLHVVAWLMQQPHISMLQCHHSQSKVGTAWQWKWTNNLLTVISYLAMRETNNLQLTRFLLASLKFSTHQFQQDRVQNPTAYGDTWSPSWAKSR